MGKGVGRICCKFGLENLPLDPFRHILRYLSLYDLSNFDQILHEFSSPSFLEYFHEICHKMIISNDDNYKYLYLSLSQIKWLYSHHIVLTHLYLLDENYELGINYINLIYQHLQFLKINSEIMKNEEFLKLSFLHFPHLHTLALSSSRINDDAVQRFLRINSHLQTLTLHNTPIISNNFLNFIANNCIHLQSFKIVDCHWFTDDSISYLVGGRLNLKFLTFLGVKVIKIQSYEQIIESFSNLKLIQFLPNNNISLEIILLVIRRIAIPAMKSSILDDHILGIESIEYIYNNTVALNKKLSALDALSSSLNVIPTLIQLILTIEENEVCMFVVGLHHLTFVVESKKAFTLFSCHLLNTI